MAKKITADLVKELYLELYAISFIKPKEYEFLENYKSVNFKKMNKEELKSVYSKLINFKASCQDI